MKSTNLANACFKNRIVIILNVVAVSDGFWHYFDYERNQIAYWWNGLKKRLTNEQLICQANINWERKSNETVWISASIVVLLNGISLVECKIVHL